MPRLNPITGAPTCSDLKVSEMVVKRSLLVAGDVVIEILVKIVLDGIVYIAVEEVVYETVSGRRRRIKRGAVLMANRRLGNGEPKFATYNNGIFDAMRAVGEHVPDTEAVELENLKVSSGSLEMLLALTWSVRRSSPREVQEDLRHQLIGYVQRWRRWQNRYKLESIEFAERAAARVGVIPFPALSPMIGAAERRLGKRRVEVRRISGRISQRHVALLQVFDQAWQFRCWVERELNAMLARFRPNERFEAKSVPGMIKRLERISKLCADVSLAPFGRRTFRHIAEETAFAAMLLAHNKHLDTKAVIERSLRSLFLLVLKREIVEVMTVVLVMRRLKLPLADSAFVDLAYGISAIKVYMSPVIDRDFQQPVAHDAAEALGRALDAIKLDGSQRLAEVYKHLRHAQAPL